MKQQNRPTTIKQKQRKNPQQPTKNKTTTKKNNTKKPKIFDGIFLIKKNYIENYLHNYLIFAVQY